MPSANLNHLTSSIKDHDAVIAIIGLGYVGLPIAIRFSEEGFKTIGFDIDNKKVSLLNTGKSYIKHIHQKSTLTLPLRDPHFGGHEQHQNLA